MQFTPKGPFMYDVICGFGGSAQKKIKRNWDGYRLKNDWGSVWPIWKDKIEVIYGRSPTSKYSASVLVKLLVI